MTFTLIFILGLVLSTATRYYLAGRHIKHIAKHRDQVPSDFANKVSLVEHHKAADYTMAKLRLGLFEIGLSAAILIAFTLLGGIQIIHNAHSRNGFALGAVLAAEFIHGKKGIFTMKDVLGFGN